MNQTQTQNLINENLEKLPDGDLKEVLFYSQLLWHARRARRYRAPTPDQWNRLPTWVKLKMYLTVLWWVELASLQDKLAAFSPLQSKSAIKDMNKAPSTLIRAEGFGKDGHE